MTTQSLVYEKGADFKHILRILNTNVEGKRKVPFAIRCIKGVGRRFAFVLCRKAKIDPNRRYKILIRPILNNSNRAGDLSETEVQTITQIIDDPMGNGIPSWFLNRQKDFKTGKFSQLASNLLDTQLRDDLERLKKIRFSLY